MNDSEYQQADDSGRCKVDCAICVSGQSVRYHDDGNQRHLHHCGVKRRDILHILVDENNYCIEESACDAVQCALEFRQIESHLENTTDHYHSDEGNQHAHPFLERHFFLEHYSTHDDEKYRLHVIAQSTRCYGRIFECLELAHPVNAHTCRAEYQPADVALDSFLIQALATKSDEQQQNKSSNESSTQANNARRHIYETRNRSNSAEEHHRNNVL